MKKIPLLFVACFLTFFLSACGGGGPTTALPPPSPPALPTLPAVIDGYEVNTVSLFSPAYINESQSNWGINAVGANWAHWAKYTSTIGNPNTNNVYLRGGGVTVALVDEGVQFNHPEFAGALITMGKDAPIMEGTSYLGVIDMADPQAVPVTMATLRYRKQYGAETYTVNVIGNATITLSTNYANPTTAVVTQTMGGDTRTVTIILGGPLTLTTGENIIANNFAQYQPERIIIETLGDFNFIRNGGDAAAFPEPILPISPYTPQALPLIDGNHDDHGTHVGGIIAGRLNASLTVVTVVSVNYDNSGAPTTATLTLTVGLAGVAPDATLLPVKILGKESPFNHMSTEQAYDYAIANSAFVANNSWGEPPSLVKISVTTTLMAEIGENAIIHGVTITIDVDTNEPQHITISSGFIWVEMPNLYDFITERNDDTGMITNTIGFRLADRSYEVNIFTKAVKNNMLIVFAQGNDGWNSETGVIRTCVNDFNTDFHCVGGGRLTLSENNLNMPTVYGSFRHTLVNAGHTVLTEMEENEMDPLFSIAATNSILSMNWLNVVAVNSQSVIAHFSNGCGKTKDFCLAAPGVTVWSAVPYRFLDDPMGQVTSTLYSSYNRYNGTSGAAPFVSGAAALLKGAFPNLSPPTVAAILKDSATGLGKCATVGREVSCVDDVYGHGMLNVSAAFTPSGTLGIAGAAAAKSYPIKDLRINLSPVFGAASWRHASFRVGALDRYGRAFPAYINLDNGIILTKPAVDDNRISGAGIHALYQAPLSQTKPAQWLPTATDALFAAHDKRDAIANIADGRISFSAKRKGNYAHQEARIDFARGRMSWRHSSGASLPAEQSAVGDFWSAPIGADGRHRFSYSHKPASLDNAEFGFVYESDGNFQQTGMRLSYAAAHWQVFGEGGMVDEDERILGATFGGGINVNKSATSYHRMGAVWRPLQSAEIPPQEDLALYASYTRTDTKTKTSGLLRALSATADELSAGLRWQNWQVRYLRPMVVTSGKLRLSAIDGYTAGGDYHISDLSFDLSAKKRRPHIIGLMHLGKSARFAGLRYAIGLNYTKNAPAKNYAGNAAGVSAALHWQF